MFFKMFKYYGSYLVYVSAAEHFGIPRVSFRGGGGAFAPLGSALPPLGNFLKVDQFKYLKI